jgi:hypothetical protein
MKHLCSLFLLFFTACCGDDVYNYNIVFPGNSVLEGTNAAQFGFLPTNTAAENAKALQQGLDSLGIIYVDQPGVYDLDTTIYMNSNTKITFGKGVYICKQRNKNGKGAEYVFINRGAYNNTYNENIEINGLNLICNKLDDNHSAIQGLVGQVSFFHVRNLTIKNFTCTDLLTARFCIQIAEFENILIENVHIEGDKDGIHLGVGKDFIIRNGTFRTLDDPIALNAHDYDISNPTVGWIENGLIENCYDLPDAKGYHFCRILAGSWVNWYQGMKLQKSDIVVNNNRLYRVIAPPDGKEYTSYTAPVHTSGYKTVDGINWYMMQEGSIYDAGCRKIHFKNIYLKRERSLTFDFHFDMDRWSRSYYPGSKGPVQSGFTFENIYIDNKLDLLIRAMTPVDDIKFINSNWSSGSIQFYSSVAGLNYPSGKVILEKIRFVRNAPIGVAANDSRSISLEVKNSIFDQGQKLPLSGNVAITSSDIPYYFME